MKKIIVLLSLLAIVISSIVLAGCGKSESDSKKIAIAFPNTTPSWERNAETMKNKLEADGFTVEVEFSATDTEQNEKIIKLLDGNPDCLIVGAINATTMGDTLEKAKEKKIPVVAYGRLILNSDAVSYLITYDGEAIGECMGKYIEAALNLKGGAGPFNIELFAGDTNDTNAHTFFNSSMKVLKPYLDNGQLVCRSQEMVFDKVFVKDWDSKNAGTRMEKLVKTYYADGAPIHAILSPNDSCADAIRKALASAGYAGPQPVLTGLDADPIAFDAIKAGTQSITIAQDPEYAVAKCIRMVKAVVEGVEPPLNDVTSFDNGKTVVPAYLCTPMIIDKGNVDDFK